MKMINQTPNLLMIQKPKSTPLDIIVGVNDSESEVKKLKSELSVQRAELEQERKNTQHYKNRVESLEDEMKKLKAEFAALKQAQVPTPSTATPISSCDETPKPKKQSTFLQLVAEAEEIVMKKTRKNKKFDDAIKEIESDLVDFVE